MLPPAFPSLAFLRPQPTHGPSLDGVDRHRAATESPSGIGANVFIVVTQMPRDVGQLIVARGPVMGDARHAAVGAVGFGRVNLADDRVLGPRRRGDGADGR